MFYRITQVLGRIVLWLYFRIRIEGYDNVPEEGGHIVVANHVSFLDPVLVCAYTPRAVHFITYARYYYLRGLHWFLKRMHTIPLKKDGKDISALKKALRLLKAEELVGIFPEGERSLTGQLGAGSPGVALMAIKAGLPILPIGIIGAYEAFPRGAKFPRFRSSITLRYGKPFRIDDELQRSEHEKNDENFQQRVTDLIMQKIAGVCT
jgi:1-acyl-sn-glycerol-3-phosphate acyltransferase